MVVVLGGVGNLWGTLLGALTLGVANKLLEPFDRRRARQDPAARLHHPVHPEAAARPVRAQGPGGGGMIARSLLRQARPARPRVPRRHARRRRSLVPVLALAVPRNSAFAMPPYVVALLGKYLCYAHPRAGARSGLGLLRHSLARPRRLLRARRLCDGHVSDAPDRRARRLRQSDPARLHGVPELEGAAGRLVGLQFVRLCDG